MLRLVIIIIALLFFINLNPLTTTEGSQQDKKRNEVSVIIEVTGDVHVFKDKLQAKFPRLQVIATYDTILQGLAIKGDARTISRLAKDQQINGVHRVHTYYQLPVSHKYAEKLIDESDIPFTINNTEFTGKGIKVAVIDTGIDMEHPDLKSNYKGGYDLVDLDDEPNETSLEEGIPTSHGTHVAGIIAANGQIKGVAPDADIYAYRALGPGGVGTSVQIIAAIEEAVKNKIDIINLSLGNSVNGPDYPTSKAVNEATKYGVAVVVANGNSGPKNWTVGSPATAINAFAVGAYQPSKMNSYLVIHRGKREIRLSPMKNAEKWNINGTKNMNVYKKGISPLGKIILLHKKEESFIERIRKLQSSGASAILLNQKYAEQVIAELQGNEMNIPIAFISEGDSRFLSENHDNQFVTVQERELSETIATFSSRGPVTVNWGIKPNIIAPGVQVLSTIPGGYEAFSGTSMATPHVAGAIAVIKEARPHWSTDQIFGALETTARVITNNDGREIPATSQGRGIIQINQAINTRSIIKGGSLSFGRISNLLTEKMAEIEIQNVTQQTQVYHMEIPRKQKGITWDFPPSIEVKPNSKITVPIRLKVNRQYLKEGLQEGWLTIYSRTNEFSLPYIFMIETDSYPKLTGFHFQLHPLKQDRYQYEIYLADDAESVRVQLFEMDTLLFAGTLLELKRMQAGLFEGEIGSDKITLRGTYYGIVTVERKNGEFTNHEVTIHL